MSHVIKKFNTQEFLNLKSLSWWLLTELLFLSQLLFFFFVFSLLIFFFNEFFEESLCNSDSNLNKFFLSFFFSFFKTSFSNGVYLRWRGRRKAGEKNTKLNFWSRNAFEILFQEFFFFFLISWRLQAWLFD